MKISYDKKTNTLHLNMDSMTIIAPILFENLSDIPCNISLDGNMEIITTERKNFIIDALKQ